MKDINCQKCGASINETSKFCHSCGTQKNLMSVKPITNKAVFKKDSLKLLLILAMAGCFLFLILSLLLQKESGMKEDDSKTYKEINEKIIVLEGEKLEQLKLVTEIQSNLNTEQTKLTVIRTDLQKLIDKKNEIEKKYNAISAVIQKAEAKEEPKEFELLSLDNGYRERTEITNRAEQSAPLVDNRKENMIKYLQKNAHQDIKNSIEIWLKLEEIHKIKAEVAICIAQADSSLGRALKAKYNIGNVNHCDNCKGYAYKSWENGIEAIYQTLNNKYLGKKQTIGSLSIGGGGKGAIYASSPKNWAVNTVNCLRIIMDDKSINNNYNIRTNV